MKKTIFLVCAILMMPVVANACGGTIIKGQYCLSDEQMNWYSAYAWCQAQGMQLVDVEIVCGSLSDCPALKISEDEINQLLPDDYTGIREVWGWTNTSVNSKQAYRIRLGWGSLFDNNGSYQLRTNTSNRALCM